MPSDEPNGELPRNARFNPFKMDWLGRAKVQFTHAPTTRGALQMNGAPTNLLQLCREVTPACHLDPFLSQCYFQTIKAAMSSSGPDLYYRRKVFQIDEAPYQGSFAVDFVVKPFDAMMPLDIGSNDSKPMLVALHGLTGGSHEAYIRHVIAPLTQTGPWEACVVISRGCAGSRMSSGIFYNARSTWDIRHLVRWLREKYPNRTLFGIGFSLGASILTNVR